MIKCVNTSGFAIPSKNVVAYYWVGDLQIMIYWYKDQLIANTAMCPHMGAQLDFCKGYIRCPWHGLFADPIDREVSFMGGGKKTSTLKYKYSKLKNFKVEIKDQLVFLFEDV